MVEVLHHDVSLSVAGELELDDLYGSFQHKPFHNNTARNLCTVQILILQTTSNQYMKKYWLLVFFIQSKLYLPCWHLHAYMDVIGLGVFYTQAGELSPPACVLWPINLFTSSEDHSTWASKGNVLVFSRSTIEIRRVVYFGYWILMWWVSLAICSHSELDWKLH